MAWTNEGQTELTNLKNVIIPVTHSIEHVEAKAATCDEPGNIEYWYCTECGAAWTDELLREVTNLKNVVLPIAHNVEHVEAVAPTCDEDGNIEYWYCEDCGYAWLDEYLNLNTNLKAVILPAGHKLTYFEAKVATTCLETGHDEYWFCEECGAYFGDADASWQVNPGWIMYTGEHVRPEGAADCADVACVLCGGEVSGNGEHSVYVCQGGTCEYCNAEIEGYGCANYDTPACEDGVCYYCGGFVAGFGHENGAWAPCCDGECSYGCGLIYPATADHVDADSDDYCDECWNHLNHDVDPCVGGECSICWAYIEGKHNYVDGSCTNCGEADPDYIKKFDLKGSSMTLGNTLSINFALDNANISGTGNYIVVEKEYADGTVKSQTYPQSEWTAQGTKVSYVSFNVTAKEMNDTLTVTVYNEKGQQISNTYTDSVAAYCLRKLGTTTKAKERTLYVDMLNYGAAAQQMWEYNTDNLANAGLTETQKGYATVIGEKDNILSKGEGYKGTSLSLKDNILLNVAYNTSFVKNVKYAVVKFVNHNGVDKTVTVPVEEFVAQGSTIKYISIQVMAVADYATPVTVELYDANGVCISTTVDSMGSYAGRQTKDVYLYDAILAFGMGAYNYFH